LGLEAIYLTQGCQEASFRADLDKPVGQLQCDAINLLFAKHGLPQIAERWTG
jgi:hypothetical protein